MAPEHVSSLTTVSVAVAVLAVVTEAVAFNTNLYGNESVAVSAEAVVTTPALLMANLVGVLPLAEIYKYLHKSIIIFASICFRLYVFANVCVCMSRSV